MVKKSCLLYCNAPCVSNNVFLHRVPHKGAFQYLSYRNGTLEEKKKETIQIHLGNTSITRHPLACVSSRIS